MPPNHDLKAPCPGCGHTVQVTAHPHSGTLCGNCREHWVFAYDIIDFTSHVVSNSSPIIPFNGGRNE